MFTALILINIDEVEGFVRQSTKLIFCDEDVVRLSIIVVSFEMSPAAF